MTKWHTLLMLFMLIPNRAAISRADTHGALEEYIDALHSKDLSRLQALLGPHFEYLYYDGDVLKKIDRDAELRGLRKLFDEATFQIKEVRREKQRGNEFRITFNVYFRDSSMDLRSFFFDTGLVFDETFVATFEKDTIAKIVSVKNGRAMNRLSFGRLKYIYARETSYEYQERPSEGIFRLFDSRSHELLLWKRVTNNNRDLKISFYFPNSHKIENVLY